MDHEPAGGQGRFRINEVGLMWAAIAVLIVLVLAEGFAMFGLSRRLPDLPDEVPGIETQPRPEQPLST